MISIETNFEPDSKWNERLLGSKTGIIHQTKEFGKYSNESNQRKPVYIQFLNSKGSVVGQLLAFEYSRFSDEGIKRKILSTFNQKNSIFRWQFGPVIFESSETSNIINSLHSYLKSKKSKILGFEHPLSGNIFSNSSFQTSLWGTFLIDLSKSEEELWKNLYKHSARKNIERSKKHGITIREMSEKDLIDYHKMLQDTKNKIGANVDINSIVSLWKHLTPVGLHGFMAYQDETPMGGILFSSFNQYIHEMGIARTNKDTEDKLYSQDQLKWKIIQWGNQKKFRFYDLAGVNPSPINEKEKGIFRYKEKWGGQFIKYEKCSI